MNLFDILGPVMVGPSSSHTAGAVRIGRMARALLGQEPARAELFLHGSFASTGKGHGTHQALIAGLLGLSPDDDRVPGSFALAEERGLSFELRDIKQERPTAEELRRWHALSGLPLKRFFNTSGLQYKALALKDKLPGMSEDEQFALLATDGMLVKRPILVGEDFVLVGFREAEWAARLG